MPSCEFPARRITASLMFSGRRSARPEAGLVFGAPVGVSDSGTTGVSFTGIEQYQNRGLNPPAIFPFLGSKSRSQQQRLQTGPQLFPGPPRVLPPKDFQLSIGFTGRS